MAAGCWRQSVGSYYARYGTERRNISRLTSTDYSQCPLCLLMGMYVYVHTWPPLRCLIRKLLRLSFPSGVNQDSEARDPSTRLHL